MVQLTRDVGLTPSARSPHDVLVLLDACLRITLALAIAPGTPVSPEAERRGRAASDERLPITCSQAMDAAQQSAALARRPIVFVGAPADATALRRGITGFSASTVTPTASAERWAL